MKTDFRILAAPDAAPLRAGIERVGADYIYAPLALPHLLARSIRLLPPIKVDDRPYRWKRDDESVN